MRRRWPAVIMTALVLAGCSGPGSPEAPTSATSIVVHTFSAADAGVKPPPAGETNAILDGATTPARLILTSWGSRGCLPIPQSIEWVEASTLEITTAPHTSTDCAANYEPISQVVELSDDHTLSEVKAVRVDGKQVQFTLEGE